MTAADRSARRAALVADHLPLARGMAAWLFRGGNSDGVTDRDDYRQVAVVGLLKAADRWLDDPSLAERCTFKQFALSKIRHEISFHCYSHFRNFIIGTHGLEMLMHFDARRAELSQTLGRPVEIDEVIASFRFKRDAGQTMLSVVRIRDSQPAFIDQIAVESRPEEPLNQEFDAEDVERALSFLPRRWRQIVETWFGFDGGDPMTMTEVGARYGCGNTRVSAIVKRSVEKLRRSLAS